MDFFCAIDKFDVYETREETRINVLGWSLGDGGEVVSLAVLVNGVKVPCKVNKVPRFDAFRLIDENRQKRGENPFSASQREEMTSGAGFVLSAVYHGKIKRLALLAKYGNHEQKIWEVNTSYVVRHTHKSDILFSSESIACKEEKGEYKLVGWYATKKEADTTLEVRDSKGHIVKAEITQEVSDNMLSKVLLMQDEEMYGYVVKFVGEKKEKYTFYIRNEEGLIRLPIVITKINPYLEKSKQILININRKNIKKFFRTIQKDGIQEAIRKVKRLTMRDTYYDTWFKTHRITQAELDKQTTATLPYTPTFSLLVPTYNTPEKFLVEMIETVRTQSYPHWQLCVADGSSSTHPARKLLEKYAREDERITLTFLDKNYGISGNTNAALKLATGDYIILYDHDDFLEKNALFEVASVLNKKQYDIVYTDEDKFNTKANRFEDPNLKPDFSIDLLRSHNYITHLLAIKKCIMDEIHGFDSAFDGSQDYDLILRAIEKTSPENIYHLPKILYHWRMHAGSTADDPESKMYCYEAGKKALEEHLKRCHLQGTVKMLPKPYYGLYQVSYVPVSNPKVSIVIPNYEQLPVLKRCIDSLFKVNTYQNFEIIIVENNSKSKELFDYYDTLQKQHANVKVVVWEGKEFNFSSINNYGVTFTTGELILFLNNDTEVIEATSIAQMVGMFEREEVGVVGAKLLYPNNTVQHAGVVIGFGGTAGHVFHAIDKDDTGFMMRNLINVNYSAVTGACLMTRKQLFLQANMFDEALAVAFNDIDLCLNIRKLNKLVVFNAFSLWYHYESISRGYETSPEKKARFEKESQLFRKKHQDILTGGDPYYNANFDVGYTPFELH